SRSPQVQLIGARRLVGDDVDARRRRALPAHRDHIGHPLWGAGKQRLHTAVTAIAHPTFQSQRDRLVFHPGAIADTLYPAPDCDMKDRRSHFCNPRKSALRAFMSASRITLLVSSDDARPLSFFGGVPSCSAFNVS